MRADLVARIRSLEGEARRLEPDAEARARLRDPVLEYAERFLESLAGSPAYGADDAAAEEIDRVELGEQATGVEDLLDVLARAVDRPGLNPASGGHLGYIPGGGIYASALGDYLADVTNRYPGVFFASPGGARLEHRLIAWMAELIGYPSGHAGTFCSGGSLANLTAVVTAREAHGIGSADVPRAVAYLTGQTHHSVTKALRIAGLGDAVVREIPLDDRYRMRPDALDRQVADDRASGLKPWLVVASAGSTDVGAVDPLDAIGVVAAKHGLWYHVDGAYGAFFMLIAEGRTILKGLERSDSIVMDPHKTLFLPYGSGVVLVRNREHLLRAFTADAAYLQDALQHRRELSPCDLSPELTRPFRGLALWFPLLLHGLAPFRAALEEKLLLARYFRSRVAELGFEVGPDPDLSVVIFRYLPQAVRRDGAPRDRDRINGMNRRILDAVHRDGRIFISSTMPEGWFTLRFACVVFRTHLDTVDRFLAILSQAAEAAEAASRVASPSAT